MPMPKVTTSVVDLSNRVSAEGTYNSAIVVASKKGPIDTPTLVTSQTDFLERFTPNEKLEIGWDTALYEAYIYLAQHSNLYVVRAANTSDEVDANPALYGGCHIRSFKSELDAKPISKGFRALVTHTLNGKGGVPDSKTKHYDTPDDLLEEDDALIIYGSSQGAWNNDLSISIITDPDKVKLDGAFIINVYKNKALVETHTCSLDPSLKNGYGVNCYVETVLNASNYIRADVNDDEDVIKDTSYLVDVVGKVTAQNEVVTAILNAPTSSEGQIAMLREHTYVIGKIAMVNKITGIEAYYKATVGGTTADDEHLPNFTEDGEYLTVVNDGEVTWTLVDTLKDYETEKEFTDGELMRKKVGNKTYYYRALNSGTTGSEELTLGANTIEDNGITWCNQTQEITTYDKTLYTYIEKIEGATLDVLSEPIYEDVYLASKVKVPTTATVSDPTGYVNRTNGNVEYKTATLNVVYVAKYSSERPIEDHYNLPKATIDETGSLYRVELRGGADGDEPGSSERIKALKTLKNQTDYNIQLVMDGGYTTPEYQRAIDEICTFREDSCKGIISTPYVNEMGMITGDAQKDIVDYRKYTLNANTRNLELYTTHQLVYDEFNDRNVLVSPSCFVASRIMSVAQEYGWHWAAAGYNRGVINSLDVANSFDTSEVDTFSDAQINTIIKEPGVGQVIFDELTLLSKASDLQDAHISRYIDVYLRPRLKTALKSFLFEFNDETTRNLIVKMLKTFLDPEISSRALYDYRVVCDLTNNRPRDIQNNVCNVWIFVQCMKLAKFIDLKLIVSPYGVSYDELGYNG